MQYGWNLDETTVAVSDAAAAGNTGGDMAAAVDCEVDLGETVRAIDNMRLVVHEGRPTHAHAQNMMVSREADCRSSISSRGSASAAFLRDHQVRE